MVLFGVEEFFELLRRACLLEQLQRSLQAEIVAGQAGGIRALRRCRLDANASDEHRAKRNKGFCHSDLLLVGDMVVVATLSMEKGGGVH
jgi:hypothetical protein